MKNISNKHQKKKKLYIIKYVIVFLPIFILIIGIIIENNTFYGNISRVERVKAKYQNNDVPIVGNIFYPKHQIADKPPVLIYISGFQAQKDADPRIAVDFASRGFIVCTFDIHGHGEMDGTFGIDMENDSLNIVDWVFENLKDVADLDKVAMLGHSAGGLSVLSAFKDPINKERIKTVVTWSSPIYVSKSIYEFEKESFQYYNPELTSWESIEEINKLMPINFIAPDNPPNLLVIHHEKDPEVEYQQALLIQNKTGCPIINITSEDEMFLPFYQILPGEIYHLLFYDKVMVETINWIEKYLDINNQPVTVDEAKNFPDKNSLVGILLFLIGYIGTIVTFGYLGGKMIQKIKTEKYKENFLSYKEKQSVLVENRNSSSNRHSEEQFQEEKNSFLLKEILIIFSLFLIIELSFYGTLPLQTLSRIIIGPFIGLILIISFWYFNDKKNKMEKSDNKNNNNNNMSSTKSTKITTKNTTKSKQKTKVKYYEMLISISLSLLIIALFFGFTYTYKFFVIYPHHIYSLIKSFMLLFPLITFQNIFSKYLPSRLKLRKKKKEIIMLGLFLILGLSIPILLLLLAPAVVYLQIFFFIYLIVELSTILMFVQSKSIVNAILFELTICVYFFGATVYLLPNFIF